MKARLRLVLVLLFCLVCLVDNAIAVSPGSAVGYDEMSSGSSSSSGAREIEDGDPNATPAIPTDIYHINVKNGALGQGHAAVIIPNIVGCTYYSYGGNGMMVTVKNYKNITDALAKAKAAGYTREEHWACNAAQAGAARAAAMSFMNTEYKLLSHNCWHMVFAALQAAGTNAINVSCKPNVSFIKNKPLAAGSSTL